MPCVTITTHYWVPYLIVSPASLYRMQVKVCDCGLARCKHATCRGLPC